MDLDKRKRLYIIGSALLALFLGAMDALVLSAAMPSIVAELGGLHLYAWVYSAYLLTRAVALPIFGKLADLFNTRILFLFSVGLFLLSSLAAGFSNTMTSLVIARAFQGIAAGGNFALVYIVLSDVALPGKRARTLSFASSVWGISSVIGPTLGGIIVTYFSWRWIFFINIPLALLCLVGLGMFLEKSPRKKQKVAIDFLGATLLSGFVLGLLTLFIVAGRDLPWDSVHLALLTTVTLLLGIGFYFVEKRAKDPLINFDFFHQKGFTLGNAATFFSSFSIFSLFGYAPLFIQGALGKAPFQVGIAMLSLSLGWSFGAFFLGRYTEAGGGKKAAVLGGFLMFAGGLSTLLFTVETTLTTCFIVFMIIGLGMGCISLSTLIIVQNCLKEENLGIATSLHQFSRSLGGTIGVGICGGIVTHRLITHLENSTIIIPESLLTLLRESTAHLFDPGFQNLLPESTTGLLQNGIASSLAAVFWVVATSSLLSLFCCLLLPAPHD